MFFLWSEKKIGRFQPSLEGNFSESSSQIHTCMSKPASLGFYFQDKTYNHFCIQQDTAWVEIMGLSHQFLLPLSFFFSISDFQVDMLLTALRLMMFAPVYARPDGSSWTSCFSSVKTTRTPSWTISMSSSCMDKALSEIRNFISNQLYTVCGSAASSCWWWPYPPRMNPFRNMLKTPSCKTK